MTTSGFVQRFKGKVLFSSGSLGQFGGAGADFGLSGQISAQQSAAGIGNGSDTTEDTLFTFALPARSLDLPGRSLLIEAWGTFADNSHSKHARLYFGSEVVDTGANTTTGGIGWYLSIDVIKTGSSTQTMSGQIITGTTHGGCTVQAGAETDTSIITLKLTGQTATGSSANDIVCNAFSITALN